MFTLFQSSLIQLMLRDSECLHFMKPNKTDVISFQEKKCFHNVAMVLFLATLVFCKGHIKWRLSASHKVITFFAMSLPHEYAIETQTELRGLAYVQTYGEQNTSYICIFTPTLMYKTKTALQWKNHEDLLRLH